MSNSLTLKRCCWRVSVFPVVSVTPLQPNCSKINLPYINTCIYTCPVFQCCFSPIHPKASIKNLSYPTFRGGCNWVVLLSLPFACRNLWIYVKMIQRLPRESVMYKTVWTAKVSFKTSSFSQLSLVSKPAQQEASPNTWFGNDVGAHTYSHIIQLPACEEKQLRHFTGGGLKRKKTKFCK